MGNLDPTTAGTLLFIAGLLLASFVVVLVPGETGVILATLIIFGAVIFAAVIVSSAIKSADDQQFNAPLSSIMLEGPNHVAFRDDTFMV